MPSILPFHTSRHNSPSASPKHSPQLQPTESHKSHILPIRPLLSRRHHSSPITPTLKGLHKDKDHHHHGNAPHTHSALALVSRSRPVSPPPPPPPSVKLSFSIESPPLVLYGPPRESTGTLLSGLFRLEIVDHPVTLKSVKIAVIQVVKCKRHTNSPYGSASSSTAHVSNKKHHPEIPSCSHCAESKMELARWDVLTTTTELPKQVHGYPFSHLLPGSLPATTNNKTFSVDYFLTAEAVPENPVHERVEISHKLKVSRSIIQPHERKSVRVFPPTELSCNVTLPSVVYPNSSFTFDMALEGVTTSSGPHAGKSRWRMRKINWRIDETAKMKPLKCSIHNRQEEEEEEEEEDGERTKDMTPIVEQRIVGYGEFKTGWKTNFSDRGKIEFSTNEMFMNSPAMSCDIDDATMGLSVSHVLVIEFVVAEEALNPKSLRQAVPTGAARVLRMQFNLCVTERSGLGIAWDDEVPPTYADVPLSPPDYATIASLPKLEEVPNYSMDQHFLESINERLAQL
ncbi:hypothetical protein TRVA0_031S00936 [Trichomonascus vanleenenianus]|uniref:Ldb19p n=1 Tax=Trichomonascus vanleenenianus TaxID=2268995 RepID=UPI003ECB709F